MKRVSTRARAKRQIINVLDQGSRRLYARTREVSLVYDVKVRVIPTRLYARTREVSPDLGDTKRVLPRRLYARTREVSLPILFW